MEEHLPKSHFVTRRDFVLTVTVSIGATIGAVIGLPAIAYIASPAIKVKKAADWIPLGPLENFPEGMPTPFSFVRVEENGWEKTANSYGGYVVRSGETATAFSNVCTHLSCRVTWKADSQDFVCPCHDGKFNIQGQVVSGPPPRPLDTYQTKIEDGNLFVYYKGA
jgi:menaquinol-cytochrome c reductase iron-sulfur subunit